ncbi:WD-repeat protein, partial [Reticulomyxa filosa]
PSLSEKGEIKVILNYWIRISDIKLGWISDFDRLVANYVMFFLFLISWANQILTGHSSRVCSIDYATFDDGYLLFSGSVDKTVRVWNPKTNKQIQLFNGHSDFVNCVKFSPYHYYNSRLNVVCSSSNDRTIRFWNVKHKKELQICNGHARGVTSIAFSSFGGGRYLCSGSDDKTIGLWDVETFNSLCAFNGHTLIVRCVDFSPLQSNNNNHNKITDIGVIGGNGYTICSGSSDKTVRVWDVETTKQLIVFNGHEDFVRSVKYGSNELVNIGCANTILSGSDDKSIRLWDIRSGEQVQKFDGHTHWVIAVDYSPFTVDNFDIGGSSNVICSASVDCTIRFWDIRSNKSELYAFNEQRNGVFCLKFLQLKKSNNDSGGIYLCYGSTRGPIHIRG